MTMPLFELLLKNNRPAALEWLMKAKVEQWMNDGPQEVVRCLVCWADLRFDLGNDEHILSLAEGVCE